MLTDSENAWLDDRHHKTYCRYCSVLDLCSNPSASGFKCPLIPDYKDAAEFSERVAAKLAKLDCVLKYARLAVEDEMDG